MDLDVSKELITITQLTHALEYNIVLRTFFKDNISFSKETKSSEMFFRSHNYSTDQDVL